MFPESKMFKTIMIERIQQELRDEFKKQFVSALSSKGWNYDENSTTLSYKNDIIALDMNDIQWGINCKLQGKTFQVDSLEDFFEKLDIHFSSVLVFNIVEDMGKHPGMFSLVKKWESIGLIRHVFWTDFELHGIAGRVKEICGGCSVGKMGKDMYRVLGILINDLPPWKDVSPTTCPTNSFDIQEESPDQEGLEEIARKLSLQISQHFRAQQVDWLVATGCDGPGVIVYHSTEEAPQELLDYLETLSEFSPVKIITRQMGFPSPL